MQGILSLTKAETLDDGGGKSVETTIDNIANESEKEEEPCFRVKDGLNHLVSFEVSIYHTSLVTLNSSDSSQSFFMVEEPCRDRRVGESEEEHEPPASSKGAIGDIEVLVAIEAWLDVPFANSISEQASENTCDRIEPDEEPSISLNSVPRKMLDGSKLVSHQNADRRDCSSLVHQIEHIKRKVGRTHDSKMPWKKRRTTKPA